MLRTAKKIIKEIIVRDRHFHKSYSGTDTYRYIEFIKNEEFPVKGKDFIFHNLGTENIVVSVDRKTSKTVKPHDVWNWFDGIDFYLIEITNDSGVSYELVVWGERMIV